MILSSQKSVVIEFLWNVDLVTGAAELGGLMERLQIGFLWKAGFALISCRLMKVGSGESLNAKG